MDKKVHRINKDQKPTKSTTKKSIEKNVKRSNETDIFKDPRFASLGKDPRFRGISKSQQKLRIDKRFETMFESSNFNVKSNIDKYGRRVNNSKADDLKKYYDIASSSSDEAETNDSVVSENGSDEENESSDVEKDKETPNVDSDEEEEENEATDHEKNKESTEEDSDVEGNENNEDLESEDDSGVSENDSDDESNSNGLGNIKIKNARGESTASDSSSDEETEESDVEIEMLDHVWGELDNDAETTDDTSKRLAACNMDWDRIRAVDIMMMCNSFLPTGSCVKSVSIYPSEFGKARMAEEEIKGPAELISAEGQQKEEDIDKEQPEEAEFHREKLREYQLKRLKYYYAVIVCDSVKSAEIIYSECDGLEYESTANKVDLRFITDDVEFDEGEAKDVCNELPAEKQYKPRNFATPALQHANVKLTWDETDQSRKELSDKLFSNKSNEVSKKDLRNYVACSSEDDDMDEEDNKMEPNYNGENITPNSKKGDSIEKYKNLLAEITQNEDLKKKQKIEMEYTWGIDKDQKTKDKKTNTLEKGANPFNKYLEKQKDKKVAKKEKKKQRKHGDLSDDIESLPDGIDLNDPYFQEEFENDDFEDVKKPSSKKKKVENTDYKSHSSTQEVMHMLKEKSPCDKNVSQETSSDEETPKAGVKRKRRMLRKNKEQIMESKQRKNSDKFKVNLDDNRFSEIYTNPNFSIEPTNPNYKKTVGMEAIIQEKFVKREAISKMQSPRNKDAVPELQSMVNRLKRKLDARSSGQKKN